MLSVLLITSQRADAEYLRGLISKRQDLSLKGICNNSVVGKAMVETVSPDIVVMEAYMTFWNAQDLISSLISDSSCPAFILIGGNPDIMADNQIASKIAAVLTDNRPFEDEFNVALDAAGAIALNGEISDTPPAPVKKGSMIRRSLEVMELLMGAVSTDEIKERIESGRLLLTDDRCWVMLGSPVLYPDDNYNFYTLMSRLEETLSELSDMFAGNLDTEICIYRENNLCFLISGPEKEPVWEQLAGDINRVMIKNNLPVLQFEISDTPVSIRELHFACSRLFELRKKRFFYSPVCMQDKQCRTFRRMIHMEDIQNVLTSLKTAMTGSSRQTIKELIDELEEIVRRSFSFDIFSYVITGLVILFDHFEAPEGVSAGFTTTPDSNVHRSFSAVRESFLKLYDSVSSGTPVYSESIKQTMKYIDDHLDEKISLDAAAGHAHINSSYLSRLFRQETGLTFSEYISGRRIERAKEYLTSDARVTDIAISLGFSDAQYFSQVFKKHTGLTPMEYRKTLRGGSII